MQEERGFTVRQVGIAAEEFESAQPSAQGFDDQGLHATPVVDDEGESTGAGSQLDDAGARRGVNGLGKAQQSIEVNKACGLVVEMGKKLPIDAFDRGKVDSIESGCRAQSGPRGAECIEKGRLACGAQCMGAVRARERKTCALAHPLQNRQQLAELNRTADRRRGGARQSGSGAHGVAWRKKRFSVISSTFQCMSRAEVSAPMPMMRISPSMGSV